MNSTCLEIMEDMKTFAWKFRRENAAVKGLIALIAIPDLFLNIMNIVTRARRRHVVQEIRTNFVLFSLRLLSQLVA